ELENARSGERGAGAYADRCIESDRPGLDIHDASVVEGDGHTSRTVAGRLPDGPGIDQRSSPGICGELAVRLENQGTARLVVERAPFEGQGVVAGPGDGARVVERATQVDPVAAIDQELPEIVECAQDRAPGPGDGGARGSIVDPAAQGGIAVLAGDVHP